MTKQQTRAEEQSLPRRQTAVFTQAHLRWGDYILPRQQRILISVREITLVINTMNTSGSQGGERLPIDLQPNELEIQGLSERE